MRFLAVRFPDMNPAIMQLGLDDDGPTPHAIRFLHNKIAEGQDILSSGSVIEARAYLRRGCPVCIRGLMW
jgi:hypothetical protein